MALAKEMVAGGLSPCQAIGIGGGYEAITAAGSSQTTATVISASMSIVAGASGTNGVLVDGEIGDSVWLFNNSGNTLLVYPQVGGYITIVGSGTGTLNASVNVLTYKVAELKKVTSTQWFITVSA